MKYETMLLTEEEEDRIEEKINEYADSMAPEDPHTKEERIVLKAEDDDGSVVGGCIVNIHSWGRAVLAKLWVDERRRGQGLGSLLIRAAERAARGKNCYYLCLGTVDYMARPFYEKHGFRVFTVNKDVPQGHESWSLSKRLDRSVPDYVPKNNSAAARYEIKRGGKEDAEIISEGLDRYCERFVKEEYEYIPLGKKCVDADGRMIAAVAGGVDGDSTAALDGIWVDEAYRGRGIWSSLLGEAEREAKENGAYVMLTYACDWAAGFFFKNGYAVRGVLEYYPKGHRAYELEKRL